MAVLTSVHLLDIGHVMIDTDLRGLLARLIRRPGEVAAATVAEPRSPPTLLRGSLGLDAAAVGGATLPLHVTYNPVPDLLTAETPQRG
ncbi:MAG TPA: hypothetical protein VK281_16210 [Xanthobacteraceae bacterium]|nr:hypothetical protein [Xanthobacteraceae bacterium]